MKWRRAVGIVVAPALAAGAIALAACGGGRPNQTETPTQVPTASVPITPSPAAASSALVTASATPGTIVYTVVRGDTLFSLARTFGTTVGAILALNGISDAGRIKVGDTLRIPVSAAATTQPTMTATPSPGGPSVRIDHGPRSSNAVALTFDMGGRVEPALDIMNWLLASGVPATIFLTGAMADNPNTDAGRQVLARIDAHPGLFELGNHSYSHSDFRTLTADQMRDELARTEASVASHSDASMRPLFRPPLGGVDADVLSAVGPAGYAYTIMWDIDSVDWRPEADGGPSATAIAAKIISNAQGGSIVLMHLGGYNTFEALPRIVAGLQERGFQFVKVSALVQ